VPCILHRPPADNLTVRLFKDLNAVADGKAFDEERRNGDSKSLWLFGARHTFGCNRGPVVFDFEAKGQVFQALLPRKRVVLMPNREFEVTRRWLPSQRFCDSYDR
jgi:hypothetical protein